MVINKIHAVDPSHSRGRLRHGIYCFAISHQAQDGAKKTLRIEILFFDKDGTALVRNGFCVEILVVSGYIRLRNQNGWFSASSNLRYSECAGTANYKICRIQIDMHIIRIRQNTNLLGL